MSQSDLEYAKSKLKDANASHLTGWHSEAIEYLIEAVGSLVKHIESTREN